MWAFTFALALDHLSPPTGLVPEPLVAPMLKSDTGVVSTLVDLMTLAIPPQHGPPCGAGGAAGGGGRMRPGGGGGSAGAFSDLLDSARSAALQMVGITGDLRCTLGLQVRTAGVAVLR